MSGLPSGSFHLKQYSGMLQGIFEPVAERKKATLDKIFRDFPERKFILIGDSGEADLEVYTEVVFEHPGRVLGIFIRDVTSPPSKGFFDPSMGPLSGDRGSSRSSTRNRSTDSLSISKPFGRPEDTVDDDAELRAAIAASLKDMEAEASQDRKFIFTDKPPGTRFPGPDEKEVRPRLPPRPPTDPPAPEASAVEENLIDFSDDDASAAKPSQAPQYHSTASSANILPSDHQRTSSPASLQRDGSPSGAQRNASPSILQRTNSAPKSSTPPPPPPAKPQKFRLPSNEAEVPGKENPATKPPPPKPRKPSTTINPINPSPLSQVQANSPIATRPPPLPKRQTYRAAAKQKLNHAYNALPSAPSYFTAGPSSPNKPRPTTTSADSTFDSTNTSSSSAASARTMTTAATKSLEDLKAPKSPSSRRPAPPASPRRNLTSYPAAAAQYASNRLSWTDSSTAATAGGDGGGGGGGNNPIQQGGVVINKKEEMWKRRWARAKQIMEKEGVVLRSWRVGADCMDECCGIVERALEEVQERARDDIEKDGGR